MIGRELGNEIERAAILSSGSHLIIPDIIARNYGVAENTRQFTLKENERLYILQTLEKTNWKVSGA